MRVFVCVYVCLPAKSKTIRLLAALIARDALKMLLFVKCAGIIVFLCNHLLCPVMYTVVNGNMCVCSLFSLRILPQPLELTR